ncbi:MAG: response regulator [Candidatus Acidiferrales bacterium]
MGTPTTTVDGAKPTNQTSSQLGAPDRRRRKRAKITAQVHVCGVNSPEPFEEVCKSIDVSRHGLLFTAARAGYWKGQRLEVTFPYSAGPAAFNSAQQAEIVRIVERDGQHAIAVQFLDSKYNPSTAASKPDHYSPGPGVAPGPARAANQVIVLAVASDPKSSDLIRETLSSDGYTVIIVPTARKALDILRTSVPAVVMAEMEGDDIPGQDLCVIIKRDERLQRIPVILITNFDKPADNAATQQLGAMICLAKPLNPERLLQVVHLVVPPPARRSVYGASRYLDGGIERNL